MLGVVFTKWPDVVKHLPMGGVQLNWLSSFRLGLWFLLTVPFIMPESRAGLPVAGLHRVRPRRLG